VDAMGCVYRQFQCLAACVNILRGQLGEDFIFARDLFPRLGAGPFPSEWPFLKSLMAPLELGMQRKGGLS